MDRPFGLASHFKAFDYCQRLIHDIPRCLKGEERDPSILSLDIQTVSCKWKCGSEARYACLTNVSPIIISDSPRRETEHYLPEVGSLRECLLGSSQTLMEILLSCYIVPPNTN